MRTQAKKEADGRFLIAINCLGFVNFIWEGTLQAEQAGPSLNLLALQSTPSGSSLGGQIRADPPSIEIETSVVSSESPQWPSLPLGPPEKIIRSTMLAKFSQPGTP